jgi:hypothetical protein
MRWPKPVSIVIWLLIPSIAGAAVAHAEPACEKKCYKAETCPIIGDKCLSFDWCHDVCQEKSADKPSGADAERSKPATPKPPLPAPGTPI